MTIALTIVHILIAIALMAFILMQEGNDGGLSGAIGGGSSMTQSVVRKKKGLEEKVVKVTSILTSLFFLTSLVVAIF